MTIDFIIHDLPKGVSQTGVPVIFRRPLILKDFFFHIFVEFLISRSKTKLTHATGTCAFFSDVDPMNKIISGSGLCFKEGDPADLALKMQMMLENPSEVEKKGKLAREEVQRKYTNQVIAENLFQISEGLVN